MSLIKYLHKGFCSIDKCAVSTKKPSSVVQLHLLNQVNHFVILQQHTSNEASRYIVSIKCFPWLMEFVNGISPLSSSIVDQPALHMSVLVTKTTTCTHHITTTDVMCIMSCLDVREITLPPCTV